MGLKPGFCGSNGIPKGNWYQGFWLKKNRYTKVSDTHINSLLFAYNVI